jgi:hypothetical protein
VEHPSAHRARRNDPEGGAAPPRVGLPEKPDRVAGGREQYGVPHLLRALDADLAASIDRLERARAGLPVTLRHRTPVDLRTAPGTVTDDLSRADRTMLMIYALVLDDSWRDHLHPVSPDDRRNDAGDGFEQLDPDVDESTRRRIAAAIAAATQGQRRTHVLVSDVQRHASRRPDLAGSTVLPALREIYHSAQIDILKRAYAMSQHSPDVGDEPTTRSAPDA